MSSLLRERRLGLAAVTGAMAWVGVIAVLHLLRPDLAPGDAYISNYARGDWAWLMRCAFVVNAAGWAAAGGGLRRTVPGRPGVVLAVLAWLGATGLLVASAFRADPLGAAAVSAEGWMHSRGAGLAFIALVALGFVGSWAFRSSRRWVAWSRPSLAYGVVALALLVVYLAWPTLAAGGFGWWQRALAFAVIPAWLAALGFGLVRPVRTQIRTYRTDSETETQ